MYKPSGYSRLYNVHTYIAVDIICRLQRLENELFDVFRQCLSIQTKMNQIIGLYETFLSDF